VEKTVTGECDLFPADTPWFLFMILRARGQKLRKCHSVPVLRLVPSDRPLFFCENCCSANLYVPICLWCRWTSAAAMKNFEEKTPRGRTISTPKLCSAGSGRMTKKDRSRGGLVLGKLEPRGSLDTERSTEPPETPRSLSHDDSSPAIADLDEWVELSVDEATLPTMWSSQPPSDPYHRGRMRNKKSRLSAFINGRNSTISFNRFTHAPWSDDGLRYGSQPFSDDESQGFRRSTDFRHSGTKSEGYVSRRACNPTRTRTTAAQSSSPPPSFNRRPLYHYIRDQAATPHSTFDCGAVPDITPKRHIPPQQGASHLAWQPTEAFPLSVYELNFPTPVLPAMSFSKKGFSLSGETEQRMNLARMVHDGQFVFHENKPPRKRDRIMRGLRRSFKSFFNLKVDG